MLIIKRRSKLKLESVLSKKLQFSKDFSQKLYHTFFNNSVAMSVATATVDVPWDWFVFRMKAYQYKVKVRKFSASHCLPFQHSTDKNQPVGGLKPSPPRPV